MSSGSMIQYQNDSNGEKRGILIDLEYAKKFDNLTPHVESITVRISTVDQFAHSNCSFAGHLQLHVC